MKQENLQQPSQGPIIVIFEVTPTAEGKAAYLEIAAALKQELSLAEGFISGERYQSLSDPNKLLSINIWENEEALTKWRNNQQHQMAQRKGHHHLFEKYSIKVASITRQYTKQSSSII